MRWDVFCRVVDNFGDVGVCWRLATDLAGRGCAVRLFIDDASALAWLAPGAAPGVTVLPFDAAPAVGAATDVVVEAFGCDPPAAYVAAMVHTAPVWINLEYLSAESHVEQLHGLPSPQPNGLVKRFFFPGFTKRTGGLLREPGLLRQRASFAAATWSAGRGIAPHPGERLVGVFCYPEAPLATLLTLLADAPTLVLLAAGTAAATGVLPADVRVQRLPYMAQPDFDRLLWTCDLNFVRGEDSLVRAHWAGAPFVWQIYPQHDGVHRAKLEALIDRIALPPDAADLWRAWNGFDELPARLPPLRPWQRATAAWRSALAAQDDLATQLLRWARR